MDYLFDRPNTETILEKKIYNNNSVLKHRVAQCIYITQNMLTIFNSSNFWHNYTISIRWQSPNTFFLKILNQLMRNLKKYTKRWVETPFDIWRIIPRKRFAPGLERKPNVAHAVCQMMAALFYWCVRKQNKSADDDRRININITLL